MYDLILLIRSDDENVIVIETIIFGCLKYHISLITLEEFF